MKKMILRVLTCLLVLTVSTLSHAGGSQDSFDTLAYLQFRVGKAMAARCTERLPEYETQFNGALTMWSHTYHEHIERGRSLAQRADERGNGNLDVEIDRRVEKSKQAFAQMSGGEVRSRCESMLAELRVKK